jgi:putative peptidoglycan lipid II flippase
VLADTLMLKKLAIWTATPLFKSMVIVSLLLFFQKGLGFGKEVMVANLFGASVSLEAMLVSMTYLSFPISIFSVSLQSAFVSIVSKLRGEQVKKTIFIACLVKSYKVNAGLIVIWFCFLFVFSNELFANSRDVTLFMIFLLPYAYLGGVNLLFYGFLQTEGRFTINGIVPCISPVLTIAIVLLMLGGFLQKDVLLLVLLLSVATIIEYLVLRSLILGQINPNDLVDESLVKRVMSKARPIMFSVLLTSLAPLLEQYVASRVYEAGVVLIRIGSTIPLAVAGLAATITGTVALPFFARRLADSGYTAALGTFAGLSLAYAVLAIFGAFIYWNIAEPVMGFFYDSELYSISEWRQLVNLTQYYAVVAVFSCLYLFVVRYLVAAEFMNTVMFANLVFLAVFVSILFGSSNSLGLFAIPVAQAGSFAAVLFFLIGRLYLHRRP